MIPSATTLQIALFPGSVNGSNGSVISSSRKEEIKTLRNQFFTSVILTPCCLHQAKEMNRQGRYYQRLHCELDLYLTLYISFKTGKELLEKARLAEEELTENPIIRRDDLSLTLDKTKLFAIAFIPGIAEKLMLDLRKLHPHLRHTQMVRQNELYSKINSVAKARNIFLITTGSMLVVTMNGYCTDQFENLALFGACCVVATIGYFSLSPLASKAASLYHFVNFP